MQPTNNTAEIAAVQTLPAGANLAVAAVAPQNNLAPVPQQTAIAPIDTNNVQQMMLDDAGAGLEEVDSSSFSIPYISILQAQSPIVMDALSNGNPNIKAGLFYNSVSGECFSTFLFIPCYFKRLYQRWNSDREFEGSYTVADVESGKVSGLYKEGFNYFIKSPKGVSELSDTRLHYVLYLDNKGSWSPAVFALSKTQIKCSKKLITQIKLIEFNVNGQHITPPSWAVIYKASIQPEKNNKGSWFSWNFTCTNDLVKDPKTYKAGRALHKTISEMNFSDIPSPDYDSTGALTENKPAAYQPQQYAPYQGYQPQPQAQAQAQQQYTPYQGYQPQAQAQAQQQYAPYQGYQPQAQAQVQQQYAPYQAQLAPTQAIQAQYEDAQNALKREEIALHEAQTQADAANKNLIQTLTNIAQPKGQGEQGNSGQTQSDVAIYQSYINANNAD